MRDVRCVKCDKLLAKTSTDVIGVVEVKCPRCKQTNELKSESYDISNPVSASALANVLKRIVGTGVNESGRVHSVRLDIQSMVAAKTVPATQGDMDKF